MNILNEIEKYLETPNMQDSLYNFVQSYVKDMNQPKDYGNGQLVYMIEAHTIKYIADNPGVTVTDISNYWKRTKSTISLQISKLEQNGYIMKKPDPKDLKKQLIYLTEKGEELNKLHINYDLANIKSIMEHLLKEHSIEEIAAFYSVMDSFKNLLDEEVL